MKYAPDDLQFTAMSRLFRIAADRVPGAGMESDLDLMMEASDFEAMFEDWIYGEDPMPGARLEVSP